MRYSLSTSLLVTLLLAASSSSIYNCEARRSSSSSRPVSTSRSSGRSRAAATSSRRTSSRSRDEVEDYSDSPFGGLPMEDEDDTYDDVDDVDEEEEYDGFDDEYEAEILPRSRSGSNSAAKKGGRSSSSSSSSNNNSSNKSRSRRHYEDSQYDDNDDDYVVSRRSSSSRRPPSRASRNGRGSRDRVVPYGSGRKASPPAPSAFTRGLSALRDAIPAPTSVRDAAFSAAAAARDSTSKISSNFYREVKGLTSSELEQVMLKATKPDDTPVKGKHAERLVGVTYQISGRYDIYDAVLRKLWSKMTENDWRTTIKALYILHRFSADGAPDHQHSLKARLRELRRTVDPKRKDKFFNSKQLLAGDSSPATIKYRALLSRYSHYVLLRAQCFGGMFNEIGQKPPQKKSQASSTSTTTTKPITSTCLGVETLDAAQMILKAGCACALKEGEVCENTAIAIERVVADLMGLTSATASALNRALSDANNQSGVDGALIQKWCQFYSEELLPKTKTMMKRTSPKLDAFGLFLPSRIGASVSQDLLEKGLAGQVGSSTPSSSSEEEQTEESTTSPIEEKNITTSDKKEETLQDEDEKDDIKEQQLKRKSQTEEQKPVQKSEDAGTDENLTDDYDVYDEYEYDEEEYYDEE
eukprot:CAMPEP_0197826046 /NCGR_PEP_ID=MMETSP1437-20131217/3053_1 /TAXON_ID=49252 ORGANISM="Eucampia antarctica, Strain CCMP1452" /NCGR_SAMPLE_ID=MMETSP1437 /ASSEMBLY_ACC=CAM_ASM_001096 /LENGTH=639 /DNA_ID=CAMNT_0043426301 /DNA_START=92 /DNA_END=2011 /DNA_ORIENTATION=+